MKTRLWLKTLASWLMVLAITLSVVQTGQAQPVSAGSAGDVAYDPNTGALAFIGTGPDRAVSSLLINPSTAPVAQNAAAFVSANAAKMGLNSVSADLSLPKTSRAANGRATTRYHQVYYGIPVFASSVIVNTNARGAMTSLTAKTSPKLQVDIHPVVTAEQAAAQAIAYTAKYENVPAQDLTAGAPELQIYDARLLLNDGLPARLVWKVTVTARSAPVSEVVLVDARKGVVSLHYNQIDTAFHNSVPGPGSQKTAGAQPSKKAQVLGTPLISVYSYNNGGPTDELDSGTLICDQATASLCLNDGDPDIVSAYQYSLDTYDFYSTQFGRDSIDDGGIPIVSSVHLLSGFQNAFWSSADPTDGIPDNQMYYGDGFSAADDVVGHELTHGVTQFESGLIYFAQPGAINESLSDIFGEFIDQTNGRGNDSAAVNWLMGEDIPGLGAIRSMSNPPLYGDPDKMTSPYYYLDIFDNAGVHSNSGVSNKAAYLMTRGGTFNGKSMVGLGLHKTAAIYYEVQANLLGSGSNYFDLYYALNQACTNLLGSTPPGAASVISSSDCGQVRIVTNAVEMNMTKSASLYPVAPYCPAGMEMKNNGNLFFDDFENGKGKWFFTHNAALPGHSEPYPDWFIGSGDSAGKTNSLIGGYVNDTNDAYATMAAQVTIPASGNFYMHFEHDDVFEANSNYDGGRVEYKLDNGAWTDAAPLFSAGRNYNGVISSNWDNPLKGQKAFTYSTINYTGTRYNLAALKGHKVRFRFRAANDFIGRSTWFVDNVRIYQCIGIPAIPALVSPANDALLINLRPTLDWTNTTPSIHHYQVQVDNDPLFGSPEVNVNNLANSTYKLTAKLQNNKTYYWRVRALNVNGSAKGWSAARKFRTVIAAPVNLDPSGATGTRLPVFDWDDTAGASGYILQVSRFSNFSSFVLNKTINAAVSSYTPSASLPAGATLFWRVKANGPNGPSPWSAVISITTP